MIRGHAWTIGRHLLSASAKAPPSEPFRLSLRDERFGQVELRGRFDPAPRARELVVLVHGLGGCSESSYLVAAVRLCRRLGLSCLRLDLRGADLRGDDMYHAGLSRDLHAVLTDPRFDGYERRYLWGYSLGGHVCLRYAADYAPGDVDAVAAITAPLDLDAGAAVFDSRTNPLYRRHVMAALLRMYRAFVARRGPWPLPLEQAERLSRIRDFDDAIVAPRYGFEDASDYYVRASVSHVLHRIDTRALLVHARHDPMVPSASVEPLLQQALPGTVSALLVDQGGHVAFPRAVDLGQPGALGLEAQVLTWLRRKRGEA
jgi:hypothetical protein